MMWTFKKYFAVIFWREDLGIKSIVCCWLYKCPKKQWRIEQIHFRICHFTKIHFKNYFWTLKERCWIYKSKENIYKLLELNFVESESEVPQSCPTLCDPMDCSLQGSSIPGIFQARVLEWVVISFSNFVERKTPNHFQSIFAN